MKHLKPFNESSPWDIVPRDDSPKDPILFFYYEVLKSVYPSYIWEITFKESNYNKGIQFSFGSYSRFEIYYTDKKWKIVRTSGGAYDSEINNLNDVIAFISKYAYNDLDKRLNVQATMWTKALEIDPLLYETCPSHILEIIKPALHNIKNMGTLDENVNYDPDALPSDPDLIFYWTVFKAAEFFENFRWIENQVIKVFSKNDNL